MQKTAKENGFLVLSVVFAAIPVAFSLIRAVTTGTDFRSLWMLVAAVAAAFLLSALGNRREGARVQRSAVTLFAVCTVVAAAVGALLGARSAAGVGMVAAAFGACIAASITLFALSRRHPVRNHVIEKK